MKKKGKLSLTVKLSELILFIVLALAIGLAVFAYRMNADRVNSYYMQSTSRAAAAVAAFVDGDKAERLLKAIKTDEFKEKREAALAADDDGILKDWLKEQELYDIYLELYQMLGMCRDKLGTEYVYLQSLEHNVSINIVDPDEDIFYMGSLEETPPEYSRYQSTTHIKPMLTHPEFGYLCSAYEPVVNSEGQTVCLAGVDINMNDVTKEREQYLVTTILFALALMIVASLVTVILMKRIWIATRRGTAAPKTAPAPAENKENEKKEESQPEEAQDERGKTE